MQNMEYDVFCSGTAALPDGRALVVGGTSDYSFTGDNRASIFDPATERFVQSQSMVDGRWYATATTLGDGRVMAFSGLGLSGGTNNTVEIYDLKNAGAGWTSPVSAPFSPPLYPHMFLLPNGKVFYTGQGSGQSANAWTFDPMSKTWTLSAATTRARRLRLGRPFAAAAAKLHTESHELWRRQSSYGYYRDHRPLRCLAQLDARAQYVNGPHPDERSHSAQRHGARRGRLGEQ